MGWVSPATHRKAPSDLITGHDLRFDPLFIYHYAEQWNVQFKYQMLYF